MAKPGLLAFMKHKLHKDKPTSVEQRIREEVRKADPIRVVGASSPPQISRVFVFPRGIKLALAYFHIWYGHGNQVNQSCHDIELKYGKPQAIATLCYSNLFHELCPASLLVTDFPFALGELCHF